MNILAITTPPQPGLPIGAAFRQKRSHPAGVWCNVCRHGLDWPATRNRLQATRHQVRINDSAPRDRSWLLEYARQPLVDGRRTRAYLQHIASWDATLDLADPGPDPSLWKQAYDISRGGGALLGRKAFLYATPGTRLFRDPAELQAVLDGLRAFARSQDQQGRFIWGDARYYQMGTHEHVWRLEPLVWARLWLENDLAERDKRWIDRMIRRAARYLLKVPRIDNSNQGVIWCYGCRLAGLYLDDRRYIAAAERHADGIIRSVVDEQGQIRESSQRYYRGGGPCSNYTFTGWTYVMLYRLLSGRSELDDRLVHALRWLTMSHTRSGMPLAIGASVRMCKPRTAIADTMHGLEFYRDAEPYFSAVIDRFLPGTHEGGGHALHPAIWAAKAHEAGKWRPSRPAWHRDFEQHYETPPSQYFLAAHRYQAGVVLRGVFPFKGIQTFASGNEPPIIHPRPGLASTTRCGAIDTAEQNVDAGPKGWEVHYRRRGPGDADQPPCRMTSITTRRGEVWEAYLFTAASVIYMVGGSRREKKSRWVLNGYQPPEAHIDHRRRVVAFEGREACIRYHHATARLATCDGYPVLEVVSRAGPLIIGFGTGDLRFEFHDPKRRRLRFRDASGRYLIRYDCVLDDHGLLRRWWGNMVDILPSPAG
jgi:hypothetical protein